MTKRHTRTIWVAFSRARSRCEHTGEMRMEFSSYRAELPHSRWPGMGDEFRMRKLSPFGHGTRLENPARWLTVRIEEHIKHAVGTTGGYFAVLLHETPTVDVKQEKLFG